MSSLKAYSFLAAENRVWVYRFSIRWCRSRPFYEQDHIWKPLWMPFPSNSFTVKAEIEIYPFKNTACPVRRRILMKSRNLTRIRRFFSFSKSISWQNESNIWIEIYVSQSLIKRILFTNCSMKDVRSFQNFEPLKFIILRPSPAKYNNVYQRRTSVALATN